MVRKFVQVSTVYPRVFLRIKALRNDNCFASIARTFFLFSFSLSLFPTPIPRPTSFFSFSLFESISDPRSRLAIVFLMLTSRTQLLLFLQHLSSRPPTPILSFYFSLLFCLLSDPSLSVPKFLFGFLNFTLFVSHHFFPLR